MNQTLTFLYFVILCDFTTDIQYISFMNQQKYAFGLRVLIF